MKKKKILIAVVAAVLVAAVAVTGGIFAVNRFKIEEIKKSQISLPDGFAYTGHTGCMGTDDNSLESIEKAVEFGAGIVEFDLNFTAEGEPVLAHDEAKGGEVTLDEAFKKVSEYDGLRVNVDIKNTMDLTKVRPLAEKHGIADRIFYTGVKDEFLDTVRKEGGNVPYYLNVNVESESAQTPQYLMSLVEKVKESGAIGINFNKDNATAALVETFHANGLLVSIWTVDGEYDMYRVLSYAPDNITTRKPDKLRSAIESIS